MALKKINKFVNFDIAAFLKGKELVFIGKKDWVDFDTHNLLGEKAEIVIIKDETDYGDSDGESVSNIYEKLTVKVPARLDNIPLNSRIHLVNPHAVVYGEYRNELSITAEKIELIGR